MSIVELGGSILKVGAGVVSTSGVTSAYDGALAINSAGRITNGGGIPIMLRGMNCTGLENQLAGALSGGFQSTVWGNFSSDGTQTTSERGPSFPAIATWKPNFLRFLLNANSFLNVATGKLNDPSGVGTVSSATWSNVTTADASSRYKPAIQDAVDGARSIKCYMSFDYHCASPSWTLGATTAFTYATGQPPFMCYDSAFPFWCGGPGVSLPCYLASVYGSAAFNTANGITNSLGVLGAAGPKWNPSIGGASGINDIIFELFNEPFLNARAITMTKLNVDGTDSGVVCPSDPVVFPSSFAFGTSYTMLNGGWSNWFDAQGADIPATFKSPSNANPSNAGGQANCFAKPWRVLGYQPCTTILRGQGFTNIICCNTQQFTNTTREFPYICPVDTLSPPQIAVALHSYPTAYNSATSVPAVSDGGATWHTYIDQLLGGTLGFTAPSWTVGWAPGRVVPVLNNEWGDAGGINCTASSQYDLQLLNYATAAVIGSYHPITFNWTGPNVSTSAGSSQGQPAGVYPWQLDAHVPANTVTAIGSITGTVLTLTGAPSGGGATILPGMIFLSGFQGVTGNLNAGTYILPYGTNGTTGVGGTGTYAISNSQTVGAGSTFTFGMPVPLNGHGTTVNTWMISTP